MVAARGGRVILEVQAPLVRLLSRMPGVERVIACGEALPDFDLHCPLMSLPHAFGTRLDTVPAKTPYLHPDPALVAEWATRLPAGWEKRVGLVWAGSPRVNEPRNQHADRRRSLKLRTLAPLGAVPGVQFVSLQLGPPAAEAASSALRPLPARPHAGDPRFRRHRRAGRQSRPDHRGGHFGRASRRRARQAGLAALPLRRLLALAHGPRRQPVVSDNATLSAGAGGELATGHRPCRGRSRALCLKLTGQTPEAASPPAQSVGGRARDVAPAKIRAQCTLLSPS